MQHLVLGSSGLVGRYLVKYLQDIGESTSCFDIKLDCNQDLRNGLYCDQLHSLIKESDFVYFLGYDVGGYKYLTTKQSTYQYIQNNISIMSNTFALLKIYDKPFIFTSTQLVSLPNSAYGALKTIGEHYTRSLGGRFARLWNIYGKEIDTPEKTHVIHDFIVSAISNNEIKMLSNGNEERQFLHGEDCASALYTICKNYDKISIENHVTSFNWIPILNIAEMISYFTGAEVTCGTLDTSIPKHEPNDDILNYWHPRIPLSLGIDNLIKEYRWYTQ